MKIVEQGFQAGFFPVTIVHLAVLLGQEGLDLHHRLVDRLQTPDELGRAFVEAIQIAVGVSRFSDRALKFSLS